MMMLLCAGVEARDVLSKTSLPVKTLAQIWYVCTQCLVEYNVMDLCVGSYLTDKMCIVAVNSSENV